MLSSLLHLQLVFPGVSDFDNRVAVRLAAGHHEREWPRDSLCDCLSGLYFSPVDNREYHSEGLQGAVLCDVRSGGPFYVCDKPDSDRLRDRHRPPARRPTESNKDGLLPRTGLRALLQLHLSQAEEDERRGGRRRGERGGRSGSCEGGDRAAPGSARRLAPSGPEHQHRLRAHLLGRSDHHRHSADHLTPLGLVSPFSLLIYNTLPHLLSHLRSETYLWKLLYSFKFSFYFPHFSNCFHFSSSFSILFLFILLFFPFTFVQLFYFHTLSRFQYALLTCMLLINFLCRK